MGVVSCGTTMLDQGVFKNIGSVTWDTTAKTSGFTAVSGNGYFCNTTSAAFTVTLPSSPSAGDIVGIKDYANTADTNNITIGRNGSNIQGTADDYIISTEGRSVFLVYVDATKGWLVTGSAKTSDISENQLFVTATGGTILTCGNYKTHLFTSPGTFCVSCAGNPAGSTSVDYLVVAGGGGGGRDNFSPSIRVGGGGGAGGFRVSNCTTRSCLPAPSMSPLVSTSAISVSVQGYPISVGGGGGGGSPSDYTGSRGSNSIFSSITSTGGGGGQGHTPSGDGPLTATPGGSGGATQDPLVPGGFGTGNTPPVSPPQGNPTGSPSGFTGGGGGGAGAAGGNAPSPTTGGSGGIGSFVSDSYIGPTAPSYGQSGPVGSTRYFAGGGGSKNNGSGGTGGGGSAPAGAGTANTGGGGGGARLTNAGSGGSGIVMIRYKYQ